MNDERKSDRTIPTFPYRNSTLRDLVVENVILSGSVGEATEVHVTKPNPDHEPVLGGRWFSSDGRTTMPHWCSGTKGDKSSYNCEQSQAELFEQASDIDFMLQLGPVTLTQWFTFVHIQPTALRLRPPEKSLQHTEQ